MLLFEILLVVYGLKVIGYIILLAGRKTTAKTSAIKGTPSVDIILPMYNEEKVIEKTINNLLDIAYGNLSVIVIDDGSTDQSLAVANACFGNDARVKILHQQNAGKSSALNRAMHSSQSDIVICIDADTLIRPDAIDKLLPYFQDEKVAAVSGYIKVGNRVNLYTEMQYLEYITIQDYERIVFDSFNGILVVPGALGAFRRSALMTVGGFTSEALAEDCDITLRMLCKNYIVRNAPDAIAFTEAPSTARMFFRQRVRWTVGLFQGLLKHGKRMIAHPNKALSFLILPYTWLYRLILPFFVPLVDYYFIYACLFLGRFSLAWYYLPCILAEAAISFFILLRNKEDAAPFKLIFLQRLLRHLTFITYLCLFFKWYAGNLYGWTKIPRHGNVKLD